jgi:hypothetical protein
MAEVKKARIFLRRGTDADRLQTDLCEGELGYSTDGTRIFVGDGSTNGGKSLGSSMIFKPESFNTTTLTAVSSDGRAEVGDFVFTHAADYQITTINAAATPATITPDNSFGTVYTLSAIDPSDGSLTWVPVNSAIPLNHIDIPDNGINGDKIHGGDVSGAVTFSGSVSASTLTATNVSASNIRITGIAGSGNRPVIVDSDGDLITSSGGSGQPVALAGFIQASTLKYDFNIASVDLVTVAAFNTDMGNPELAIGGQQLTTNTTYNNVKEYTPFVGAYVNEQYGGATSGIYKITLTSGVAATDAAAVDIQAYNWRAPYVPVNKSSTTMSPVIDYYWKSTTILYVVFSVAVTSNVNHNATTILSKLYPSSGLIDTRTRFNVKIY